MPISKRGNIWKQVFLREPEPSATTVFLLQHLLSVEAPATFQNLAKSLDTGSWPCLKFDTRFNIKDPTWTRNIYR